MRRTFIKRIAISIGVSSSFMIPLHVYAQDKWPNKPIRMLVGFTAGGPTDFAARFVAEALGKELNTSILVENKPGANGQNAINELKRYKADGYTIMLASSGTLSVAPARHKELPYDVRNDFSYIGTVTGYPYLLVTGPSFKANNMTDLVRIAKSRKDGLSAAAGSQTQELTVALFNKKYGTNVVPIPYKGDSHTINDLVGERLDFAFVSPSVAMPLVQNGKLKALGATGKIAGGQGEKFEPLKGVNVSAWNGIIALKGTPDEVQKIIGEKLMKVLSDPKLQAAMEESGQSVMTLKNGEFQKYVLDELHMWEKLADEAGLKKL